MHETLCRTKKHCDCINTNADERYCDSDLAGFHRCGESKQIRFIEESKVCDGRSDCVNGEDEIETPDTEGRCRFGLSCWVKKGKKQQLVRLLIEISSLQSCCDNLDII